jgi:hypothetical protein
VQQLTAIQVGRVSATLPDDALGDTTSTAADAPLFDDALSRVPPSPVVAAAGDAPKEQSGLAKTLGLGFLFALWYAFNIQFNM